ncbi:MAG TPA: hypothetical protein PK295_02285 [Candidatus Magasanikbacteria bacterium]|nr:hypothetical protein [Candidatus Magasanikbacteria bacterium]
MASKKGNFVARFARGAALAAAIGSGKPASATSTEQNQASQIYRSQNSARNTARQAAADEDENTSLELDDIQASLEPGVGSGPNLQATPDGRGGVKLKLKFDVPLNQSSRDRVNETIQKLDQKRNNQRIPTNSSTSSTNDQSTPSSDTPENMDIETETPQINNDADQKETSGQSSTPTSDKGADIEENPFPISDTESNPSSEEAQENEEDEENEDETEEDQNKFLDRALKEEQMREQMLEQERGKKKQEVQKKRNLGMRILQQTQQQEMALKQDQQMAKKLSRAMQIKQKLDQKINNLRLKKLPLQLTLRALQISRMFIWVVRGLLQVLIFICTLLSWTIVLGIVGFILKGVDWLLAFMQRGMSKLIDILEKKIDSINEDIDKAKENRKKAISVIQSIQRQKRVGPRLSRPKFDVPQAV